MSRPKGEKKMEMVITILYAITMVMFVGMMIFAVRTAIMVIKEERRIRRHKREWKEAERRLKERGEIE